MKLNAKVIATLELPRGKSDAEFWDDDIPGFGVRVRTGSRKFIYRYRVGKVQRRISLGPATPQTFADARTNAGKLAAKVHLGEDPAHAKEAARQDAEHTFGLQVERYLEARRSELKPHPFGEIERYLNKYATPLHKLPLKSVSQLNVANLLNTVAKERGDVSANRLRATLSAFFAWVLSEGIRLPEGNPVQYTRKREEKGRDRVLSHAELKKIWNACDGSNEYHAIVKLLMLTGQRREEIAGLRWSEITDEQIDLPKERTKNERPHIVPLSDAAKEILDRIPREGRQFVFGRADTGFSGFGKCKERLDARTGVSDWTIHDLRRTFVTRAGEDIGIAPHIVEAVVNHVSGHKAGVAGRYNHAQYLRERQAALKLWAEHLMSVVQDRSARVVPLKRGA